MNSSGSQKPRLASRLSSLPPSQRRTPSRRDSDLSHLLKREEKERVIAEELDAFRDERGQLPAGIVRQLTRGLLEDYECLDRERFADELADRIEIFPDSSFLVRYLVSLFAVYEFTRHQDLTVKCADFCLSGAGRDYGMASAYSTLLSKVVENAMEAGVPEEARRTLLSETMAAAEAVQGSVFGALRVLSEVSTFAYLISIAEDGIAQPEAQGDELPPPDADLYSSFLRAFRNTRAAFAEDPAAAKEFFFNCMDICKACRTDLFRVFVRVAAWAGKLKPADNAKYVREALLALKSWDLPYLKALEANLARHEGLFPLAEAL